MNMYDWIPFFKELSERIIESRSSIRDKTILILGEAHSLLQWPIDPFTFIYTLVSRNSHENLTMVRDTLGLSTEVPKDRIFPTPPGLALRGFHYKGDYSPLSESELWDFFSLIINSPRSSECGNLFEQMLKIKNVGIAKLTQTLFLINPDLFIPIDKNTIVLFPGKKIAEVQKSLEKEGYSAYIRLMDELKKRFKGCEFWEMNRLAYGIVGEDLKPDFDTPWFQISSQQDGHNEGDYIEDWFSMNNITMGYNEGASFDLLESMKPGDIVVARNGMSKFHGIGLIFNKSMLSNPGEWPSRREVIWLLKDKSVEMTGFARSALVKIQIDNKVYEQISEKYPEFCAFIKTFSIEKDNVAEPTIEYKGQKNMNEYPKNLILYGPPGTGKTYMTRRKALEIIDPYQNWNDLSTKDQKARYTELVEDKKIAFVTFHQSFGYEEFVEGIRPIISDEFQGNLSYEVKSGIFKEMCERAKTHIKITKRLDFDWKTRTVWKMSLGNTLRKSDSYLFDYCLENECIFLGFGKDVSYHDCTSHQSVKDNYTKENKEYNSAHAGMIHTICNEMEPGDLVLVSYGNRNIRGLAIVTDDYAFNSDAPEGYTQTRPVNWLWFGESEEEYIFWEELLNKKISQRTLYNITPNIKSEAFERTFNTDSQGELSNYVLIIDEINRGNVSRIFGELITLIEEDKRAEGENPLVVNLPYSGKPFSVPSNLYILATMNTADRSLVALDTALRRRFEFEEVRPKSSLLSSISVDGIDISTMLERLNKKIREYIDRDHELGHAYFWTLHNDSSMTELKKIFKNRILPQLQEHFFDNPEAVKNILESSGISHEQLREIIGNEIIDEYWKE